jgi:hypothetical protein
VAFDDDSLGKPEAQTGEELGLFPGHPLDDDRRFPAHVDAVIATHPATGGDLATRHRSPE